MRPESFEFLQKYLNNPSPTGFEKEGQKLWLDYIKPYIDEYFVDTYGTVVGVINPKAKYKVVIEAHADEISYFVNYITKEGYLYLRRNGGSDPLVAPSKRVNIHTSKGIVKAVFGWPAIHVRKVEQDKAPTIETVFLDCGASSADEVAEMGIHVGSVVTFEDEFTVLNERFYVGRALDNRVGGFMIAEVARMLKENGKTLPFGLYIVNAVQEEIGLRGAEMIAHRINPDVAIITDVTHDSQSPMYDKKTAGDISCGKGPVITYGPAVQNNLRPHHQNCGGHGNSLPARCCHPRYGYRYRCVCLLWLRRGFGLDFAAAEVYAHHSGNGTQGRRGKRDQAHLRVAAAD